MVQADSHQSASAAASAAAAGMLGEMRAIGRRLEALEEAIKSPAVLGFSECCCLSGPTARIKQAAAADQDGAGSSDQKNTYSGNDSSEKDLSRQGRNEPCKDHEVDAGLITEEVNLLPVKGDLNRRYASAPSIVEAAQLECVSPQPLPQAPVQEDRASEPAGLATSDCAASLQGRSPACTEPLGNAFLEAARNNSALQVAHRPSADEAGNCNSSCCKGEAEKQRESAGLCRLETCSSLLQDGETITF